MFNIMVVDDDCLVRRRIISAIPFARLGLELCGEAGDGIEALEIYEQQHPQIVIMDINIPFINGIDVSQRMTADNRDVNIVIVTGYGTVDNAKAAIRSGMVDFLLKPIDFAELESVLERIVEDIQEKALLSMEQQRMERLLERSMPMLRSRYFLSLMTTPPVGLSETECRQYLTDFGITKEVNDIVVAILCPNYEGVSVNELVPRQTLFEEELHTAMRTATIEHVLIFDSLMRAILLVYGTSGNLSFVLEEKLSCLRDRMRYVYRLDFHASIGKPVSDFAKLHESYQSADKALGYWRTFGNNNIVISENVRVINRPMPTAAILKYSDIMDLLLNANMHRITDAFELYFKQLAYDSENSVQYLKQRTIELLAILLSCASELGFPCNSIMEHNPYMKVMLAENVMTLSGILCEVSAQLTGMIINNQESNKNHAISQAKAYILKNHANPGLTLTEVSEQVCLSPCYVSQLFKKTENCSFTEYLNSVRIDSAKQLLRKTNMKVYEVADAVGYQSPKYFFQVFKQLTGKSPREFSGSAAQLQE